MADKMIELGMNLTKLGMNLTKWLTIPILLIAIIIFLILTWIGRKL